MPPQRLGCALATTLWSLTTIRSGRRSDVVVLKAERQIREIIGYQHLAALAIAVEKDLAATRAQTTGHTISPTNPTTSTTTTEPAAT